MSLILSIENADRLPDGGPLRVEVASRGIDIGRDQHLDWTLPDPDRVISGKHCEIRFRDGGYWLTDVSTNGTFLNGSEYRLEAPHRLRTGDRLAIGHYLVAVQVVEQAGAQAPVAAPPPAPAEPGWGGGNPWDTGEEAAPPADRRAFMPEKPRGPRPPDFLDWAVHVETPTAAPSPYPTPAAPPPALDWGAPEQVMPTPRRPASPAWEETPAPPAWEETPAPPAWEETPAPPAWGETPAPPAWGETPAPPAWGETPPPSFESPPPAKPSQEPPLAAAAPPPFPSAIPETTSELSTAPAADTLARIARAAGIPPEVVASRLPEELAEEIGTALRLTAHHLVQMLASRAETKSLVRSANRTMIQALDNNPLKFSPTPEDALRIMFGAPTRSYLKAAPAIEESFRDLKAHQVQTYSAMQGALEALYEDLSPEAIDKSVDAGGIGGMLSSRKARLWDVYAERWKGKTQRHDGRLVDAFMLLFAECYDRLKGRS